MNILGKFINWFIDSSEEPEDMDVNCFDELVEEAIFHESDYYKCMKARGKL